MKRTLPWAVLALAGALTLFAAWRLRGEAPARVVPARVLPARPAEVGAAEGGAVESVPIPTIQVLVYFPSVEADGLLGEPREIFNTPAPGDRAKQIIADLISGPTTDAAVRALPPGTELRQVYVLDGGVAYLDFSEDLERIGGGSAEELLTVYAIIDSVALNVSEIRRVGLLVNGRSVETLNGHLDLRRPLPPDPSLIVEADDGLVVRGPSARRRAG